MQISVVNYLGDLRTESTHLASGEKIISDAPKDNNGKGSAFSPTDYLANSVAQCMVTVMAIEAQKKGINLLGITAKVTKTMAIEPRRISRLSIDIVMPEDAKNHSEMLEKIAHHCPVAKSIHPEIELTVQFNYG